MGRKRARSKTPARTVNAATRTEVPAQEEEEDEEEQATSDAAMRTPSAKRKAKTGERKALSDAKSSKESDATCMEEGDSVCTVDLAISIGGASAEFVDKVASSLPGRRAQVTTLTRLLDESGCPSYSSLFVYGHSGAGKTATIQAVTSALQVPTAYVSCGEFYSMRTLLEGVLDSFTGHLLSADNGYSSYARCDNFAAFVKHFKKIVTAPMYADKTSCIVLDGADRLRSMEATLIPAFLRLQELCHPGVCVILVSSLTWEQFRGSTGCLEPVVLHFPNYTKDETLEILSKDCPEEHTLQFYRTFIHHMWNVFNHVCRDINELRHMAAVLYPQYCEPVEKGEIESQDTRRLWTHILPVLKSSMGKVYLHEVTSGPVPGTEGSAASGERSQKQVAASSDVLELPLHTKYLLIAAYLASYNPATMDRRFFAKGRQGGKQRSKKKVVNKVNRQLAGPKPFPLDRMMAIFYSIFDKSVGLSCGLYSQKELGWLNRQGANDHLAHFDLGVSTLVSLHFLSLMSAGDNLDTPRYKCLVTLEFIRAVARSVGFDVVSYLYDFL